MRNGNNLRVLFIDETFLIGYLTPEEYFDFIGDLRGMSNADVTYFISKFDEFFNGEIIGKRKYLRDLSKEIRKKWELWLP